MYAASAVSAEVEEDTYTWTGEDEFDKLNDRVDAPPLPLPPIREARRVALVRHGQSTWNAQGRVQGSSNISYLTKKGESQAETTQQMVGLLQLSKVCLHSGTVHTVLWSPAQITIVETTMCQSKVSQASKGTADLKGISALCS